MKVMTSGMRVALGVPFLGLAAVGGAPEPTLEEMRDRAMRDVYVLRDYRPAKNSFVESPARHPGAWTHAGYRHTLLDVKGQGSIRHIWTTRMDKEPFLDWEFFVDGETRPSIRGSDLRLVAAARDLGVPLAPANYVPVERRDFNFFLPVPFDRSVRVDVVQTQPLFQLFFCQIDYRLNDPSLAGARLVGFEQGTNYVLEPRNWPADQPANPPVVKGRAHSSLAPVVLKPGEARAVFDVSGPAIIRELRLVWSDGARLRLLAHFDGAATPAVDSPVDRFFGPFKGASFFKHAERDHSCHLPMPFKRRAVLSVKNEGDVDAQLSGSIARDSIDRFSPGWGYFHARHQQPEITNGHRPLQVLYVRGRGHWLGMTLYATGHDHGGGDFAVVDGEGDDPSFLHGINGEDYFTFAWFGKGAHHPYAVAHSNDAGRYRHHFENVYPFSKSLAIEWGAYPGLRPESVAVWYQDTPEDTCEPDGARSEAIEWDVFGPVPIPHDPSGRSVGDPFGVLPSVAALDSGERFECRLVRERFQSGWMKEFSVGPMVNLTYVGRHGTKIVGEIELGGTGHAFLARRFIDAPEDGARAFLFANDDPCEIWVNQQRRFADAGDPNGFSSKKITLPLRRGRNEVVVRLTNYFNRDFNWAGFLLRPIDVSPVNHE